LESAEQKRRGGVIKPATAIRRFSMQKVLLPLAALGMFLTLSTLPVRADPYKWCAEYGRAGGRNCYFLTLEQCRMTISGIGGSCVPNQFYTGSDNGSGRGARSSRRD
jgi:hypothetical protein